MNPATTNLPTTKASKKKLVWGLICLIGPTALFVLTFLLYAVMNFFVGATADPAPTGDALFAEPAPAVTVGNTILFLVGAISVLTWLPGIIVGIILLLNRK